MIKKKIFCFSGQGSQYYQMGKELYENDTVFKLWMDQLSEIAQPIIGIRLTDTIYNQKNSISNIFNRTLYTHPAIFIFEYALYQTLIKQNVIPDIVLGASLGEYTAAAVSNIIGYKTALEIVIFQAELLEKNCIQGGMIAVLDDVNLFEELATRFTGIELSSINSKNHFVISGPNAELNEINILLKERSTLCQSLPVSYAFHSSLVESIKDDFCNYINKINYSIPEIPYFSCVSGNFLDDVNMFRNGYFWDVVRKPILIEKAISNLEFNGPYHYIDLGPSGTFANLIKLNFGPDFESKITTIASIFGNDYLRFKKIIEDEAIAGYSNREL